MVAVQDLGRHAVPEPKLLTGTADTADHVGQVLNSRQLGHSQTRHGGGQEVRLSQQALQIVTLCEEGCESPPALSLLHSCEGIHFHLSVQAVLPHDVQHLRIFFVEMQRNRKQKTTRSNTWSLESLGCRACLCHLAGRTSANGVGIPAEAHCRGSGSSSSAGLSSEDTAPHTTPSYQLRMLSPKSTRT